MTAGYGLKITLPRVWEWGGGTGLLVPNGKGRAGRGAGEGGVVVCLIVTFGASL